MRIGGVQTALLVIAVLIVPLLFQWPLAAYVTRPESQQLTDLLSDASNEALELASDAAEMQSLVLNDTELGDARANAGQGQGTCGQHGPHHREIE